MSPGKRAFDLFWSVTGLLAFSPLLLAAALIIKITDPGPAFFLQERVGYKGKRFRIWKFRSMVVDAEKLGMQITTGGDRRITPIGRWLRKLKLDELPQLFNVFLGEMSFVGPRPEVPHYVELYTEDQRRVLSLMPGITDVASIRFKDENDLLATAADPERAYIEDIMPEKIRLNLEYAKHASVAADFAVILRTLLRLISR